MKLILTLSIFLIFFISCNLTKRNEIKDYNLSYFNHNTKNFKVLLKMDFSKSIFNKRGVSVTSKPLVIDNKTIFLSAKNFFYRINYEKNYIEYKKELPYSIIGNINLVDNNKIIFFASDGNIYLTDFDIEKTYWKYYLNSESVIGDYKIIDNNIIFKTSQDRIYSINKLNSNLNWVTKSYLSDYMPLNSNSEMIINDNKIFTGFSDGKISVFSIKTGKTLYEDSITTEDTFNDITSSLVIKNNIIFVPSYRKGIVAIDLETKTKIWESKISAISKVLIYKSFGYYFSSEQMIKISLKTGEIIEKYNIDIKNPNFYFLYNNKYIVISSKDEGIFLINIDNLDKNNKIKISSGISIKPIFKNGKLIILTNNSNLYVLKFK